MIIINNIDGAYFEFNGIRYFKNFTSVVAGSKLRILNVYDSKIELLALVNYDQIILNGDVYANVASLQSALLPVIYAVNTTVINGIISQTEEYVDASYIWIPGTYSYNVTVRSFYKNGILHDTIINTTVTADAADLVDRIDAIVVNDNDTITIIKGIPALAEIDNDTQLLITLFTVTSGTTEPVGVSEVLWYNENLQEAGGEKNSVANNPPFVTLASTEQASVGTKSIKIVSRNSATLTSTTKYLGSNLSNVLIDVYLLNSTNNQLRFQLWVNNTLRVGEIYVSHGTFNFNAYLINQWQTITIPGLAFRNGVTWGNYEYDFLFLGNYKSGTTLYFDNIRFQQGLNEVITTPTNYELLANKQNSLATDGTGVKYPTVDAVNAGFATKLDNSDALTAVSPTNKLITESDVAGLGGGDMLASTYNPIIAANTAKVSYTDAALVSTINSNYKKVEIGYACSNETSDLTLGDLISIRMPFAMTLSEVRISLNNAPTITKVIVDVKESGVSIFSTLPSIDTSELTSVTAIVPAVISDVNLADDALLTVSTTQLGSGDIGKGLKILFKGVRT